MKEIRLIEEKFLWEEFLCSYSPQAFFQSWDWGEVQKKLGGKVSRFGFYEGEKLKAIFQTVLVQARRGPFLHVRHGPILSSWDKGNVSSVMTHLKKYTKTQNAYFVRISPLLSETQNLKKLLMEQGCCTAPIHAMDAELCLVLDLDKTEDELLSNMRKTTRYEIRRSEKLGIEVKKSTSPKDIEQFLSLYEKTSKRQGFVEHKGVREEFDIFEKEGNAMLFLGYHEEKLLAGALIVFYNNQAIYHHAASLRSPLPVPYILQWEAIKEAKKRGMKIYNFWGIAPDDKKNHPWKGLTLFKKGFGGREIQYMHAEDFPVSIFYFIPYTIECIRKWKKGY